MRKRKTIYSRNFIERIDYVNHRSYRKNQRRAKRIKETSKSQEVVNRRMAEMKLRLKIDMNFESGDYYLTLTFDRLPTWDEAQHAIQKFVRDLRKLYRKEGKELKYIYIAEGEKRIHFHMLVNNAINLYPDMLMKIWPYGYFEQRMYRGKAEDAIRIASYFVKENREVREKADGAKNKRRWNCSKNLANPKEKVETMKSEFWREEIVVPAGYYLDADSVVIGFTLDGYPFRIYRLIKLE